ncbi:MAG: FAD-dependent oxidoreductase [Bryobacteraceae bacterium]|nr:FAD-dependent oxidoreductase [Bryobacteraceae bacterium]
MRRQCVILAGGLATRLGELAVEQPKALLDVAGSPFADRQLTWLASEGFTDVLYLIGHLGGRIQTYVGDGSRWKLRVTYSDEGDRRLGTGGALRLAFDQGLLDPVFALTYGDSLLQVPVAAMWQRFEESGQPALMSVLRNEGRWDTSNAVFEDGQVTLYDKQATPRPAGMRWIDYGISLLKRSLIEKRLMAGEPADLAPFFHYLSREGRLAGFEATERFYEIGSPEGLQELAAILKPRSAAVITQRVTNRVGVLGGGLAGLTVAAHLDGASEVLEGGSRPGGHCQSVVEEGFTYDAGGPHILFSRNQQTLDYMVSLLDGNVNQARRANKIFFKGRYVKYPFENGLYDLEPQDRYECLYHYLHNDHPAPTNFKEWIYRTFGTGLAEKYLLPYNEKIWNVPAEQMSLDWVEGRVPKPPVADVIKAAVGVESEGYTHQLYFNYPARGGVESLPLGMAQRVQNVTPEFAVRHVRHTRDGWLVSDGASERVYERIVSTLPIVEMANIFEGVPGEVKSAVAALRHNSLFTVTIGLSSNRLPEYTAIYVPDPELIFHRLSFPGMFSPHNVPRGQSLVQAEITANAGDGIWELSDEQVLAKVVAGLEAMDLIHPSEICYTKVIRTQYGYVVQDFNYRKHLELAKGYFESQGIALCGRNAEFEYINMDQCIERGIKVAARLNQPECVGV